MSDPSTEDPAWVAYRDSITGRIVLARPEGNGWEVSDGFVVRSMPDENFRARYQQMDP